VAQVKSGQKIKEVLGFSIILEVGSREKGAGHGANFS
jgi:hypothetical protein